VIQFSSFSFLWFYLGWGLRLSGRSLKVICFCGLKIHPLSTFFGYAVVTVLRYEKAKVGMEAYISTWVYSRSGDRSMIVLGRPREKCETLS
jgi:hypothetical protein